MAIHPPLFLGHLHKGNTPYLHVGAKLRAKIISTATAITRRICAIMLVFKKLISIWHRRYTHSSHGRPIRPDINSSALQQPLSTILHVTAQPLGQAAIQANGQDFERRTASLLNTSLKRMGLFQNPSVSQEALLHLMHWRTASITEYASLMGLASTPAKTQALHEWNHSLTSLRQACETEEENGTACRTHAFFSYQELQALRQNPGASVRYAGTWGKKQTLIQSLLTTSNIANHAATSLPSFLIDAIKKGALSTPETFLSYAFDTLLDYLLEQENHPDTSDFHSILSFLQLLLPDMQRSCSQWDSLKGRLPHWVIRKGDDTVQHGLLSFLLDLIPDSHLRDECVDLVDQGVRAPNKRAVLMQWKPFFMKRMLGVLPLSLIEKMNGEFEESLFVHLEDAPDCGNPLVELISQNLSCYGAYFLEWTYTSTTNTYNLALYPSGRLLAEAEYPRKDGQPLWPLHLNNIVLDFSSDFPFLPTLLEEMSKTTAISQGWQLETSTLTASNLFGEHGLITQLQTLGACIDYRTSAPMPLSPVAFTQLDMVSRYLQPELKPALLRYQALREALLEAIRPFAESPNPLQPPQLMLPEGEEGLRLLGLFQSATLMLRKTAEIASIAPEALREITAFEEQLEHLLQARTLPIIEIENPEAQLGALLEIFLKGYCQPEGQAHLIEEYRPLLIFALGEGSEEFVDLLCAKAQQLQAESPAMVSSACALSLSEHVNPRPRKSVGTLLYALYTCLQIIRYLREAQGIIYRAKRSFTYGWVALIPDGIRFIGPKVLPQVIQDKLYASYLKIYAWITSHLRRYIFKLLFPLLKGTTALHTLHTTIIPYLSRVPGNQVPRQLPIPLPDALQNNPLDLGHQEPFFVASSIHLAEWCGSWAHFCPFSSMQLLVSRETQRPVQCDLLPFDLSFSFVEIEGKWQAENNLLYPGFWVAPKQTVPFGLLLENQNQEKQLLLPRNTLHFQALYARLDPLLGILGHLAQSQPLLHLTGTLYHYKLVRNAATKDQWVSQDPYAMVHLLLIHLSYNRTQEVHLAGNQLLHMSLPAGLETELLPLQLAPDPKTRRLYADLLVHLENNATQCPPSDQVGILGQYIPTHAQLIFELLSVYRMLAGDKNLQLPHLTLRTLYKRYCRLLEVNKALLISQSGYLLPLNWLRTEWVALQLLPTPLRNHFYCLERDGPHAPSYMSFGINALRIWRAHPPSAFFTNPVIKQVLLSQGSLWWNGLKALAPHDLASRVIRPLCAFKANTTYSISDHELLQISLTSYGNINLTLEPEGLCEKTLIPHFFTYLNMAQGHCGKRKQMLLLQRLHALQWTLPQGAAKLLSQLLCSIAAHPFRFALFNRKRLLFKIVTEYKKNVEAGLSPSPQQLLAEWRCFIHFNTQQAKYNALESISLTSLSLLGSSFLFFIGSQKMIASTVSVISPLVGQNAYPIVARSVLPISLSMGVLATALYSTQFYKQSISPHVQEQLAKINSSLRPLKHYSLLTFPLLSRYTNGHVTPHSISTVARVTGVILSMHYLAYSFSATPIVPTDVLNQTILTAPLSAHSTYTDLTPLFSTMVGWLPSLKHVYDCALLFFIASQQF